MSSEFRKIFHLARERSNKKLRVEAGIFVATTFFPPAWSVGPALVGAVNLFNATAETYDASMGKPGAKYAIAAGYLGCALFELGLQAAGVTVLNSWESGFNKLTHDLADKAFNFANIPEPDFLKHVDLGGPFTSNFISIGSGLFTNTIWYEAKRTGLIQKTPLDYVLRRNKMTRS